jgi:hypothetical protein
MKDSSKKKETRIDVAGKIFDLINGPISRNVDLGKHRFLFADAIRARCCAEGGASSFIKSFSGKRTVIGLRGLSGGESGSILKCIYIDLIHHAIQARSSSKALRERIDALNKEICYSGILSKEDIFRSVTAEIDHKTRVLEYVSAGHPPFLFIRGNKVKPLPSPEQIGSNPPLGIAAENKYSAGAIALRAGDRLIFSTAAATPFKDKGRILLTEEIRTIVDGIINRHPAAPVTDILYGIVDTVSEIFAEAAVPSSSDAPGDAIAVIGLEVEKQKHGYDDVFKVKNSIEVSKKITEIYVNIEKEWRRRDFETPVKHVLVALEEAVLNAWKHGNRRDPEKTIRVRYRFANDFHLDVTDEGGGFDFRNLPDPTSEDNRTRPNGRGLFLIRYYADEVGWEKGGKRIRMSFRKHPDLTDRSRKESRIYLWPRSDKGQKIPEV